MKYLASDTRAVGATSIRAEPARRVRRRGGQRTARVGATAFVAFVLAGLGACTGDVERVDDRDASTSSGIASSASAVHAGLIYGRVTTDDGAVYEGRLRWGGDEEALWGNYFNGFKATNPWAGHVRSEQRPKERRTVDLFGIEIGWDRPLDLGRPFLARFGDIARIDADGRDLRVRLKSGTEFHLDRYAADDLADGLRVWDRERGVVDIGEWRITSIELFAPDVVSDALAAGADPLHGTVHAGQREFTGFIQWDRQWCLGSDTLDGRGADGDVSLRFDGIRSIARRPRNESFVTLIDGREMVLTESRVVGGGNRGIYVDDARYGRVLVSWDALDRVGFSRGGTGPGYDAYLPGHPLSGIVTTRSGRRLSGRLVYDLDESETTATLDAPADGVDYMIPFGLVAAIELPDGEARNDGRAMVTLRSGESLPLELGGDLGPQNAGILVFADGVEGAEYVSWADVRRVELHRDDVAGVGG